MDIHVPSHTGLYKSKRVQQTCHGGTDKRGVPCAVLIPLCAPCLSLCVRHTLTLFQGLWCFSLENASRFAELLRVGKNRGAFGKKRRNTLHAQIRSQTIKVWHISYQKAPHKFLICVVAFFLTHTIRVSIWSKSSLILFMFQFYVSIENNI